MVIDKHLHGLMNGLVSRDIGCKSVFLFYCCFDVNINETSSIKIVHDSSHKFAIIVSSAVLNSIILNFRSKELIR